MARWEPGQVLFRPRDYCDEPAVAITVMVAFLAASVRCRRVVEVRAEEHQDVLGGECVCVGVFMCR